MLCLKKAWFEINVTCFSGEFTETAGFTEGQGKKIFLFLSTTDQGTE